MPCRIPPLRPRTSKQHGAKSISAPPSFLFLDFLLPWPPLPRRIARRGYAASTTSETVEGRYIEDSVVERGITPLEWPYSSRSIPSGSNVPTGANVPQGPSPSASSQTTSLSPSIPSTARRKPLYTSPYPLTNEVPPKRVTASSHALSKRLQQTPRSSPPLQAPTFIHHHLQQYNPPSPSTLLTHLRACPALATPHAKQALVAYSRRWNDQRTEREMTDSMLRTRLGTLRQSLGGTRPNLDHSARHLRRPNRRAIKAWPPLQALSPRYAALDLLGHLHHVLLNASPREPPPILEEALSALRVACGREADDELARDVLHLYLAYPSPDHDYQSLIETFLRLRPSVKLSRQTLHLALLSVVLPGRSLVPIHRTSDVLLVSEPQHSTCPSDGDTQTNPPVTKTVDPVTIIQSFSTRYHITPGLETYRHLARWGLFKYRPEVAKLAWDGWWTEHRRLRSLVQQGAEALRARAGRPARRTESPQTVLLNREIEIPAARFRHLGQHILRWRNQAMAKLRDKGWIERVMVDEDQEGGEMGWVWRGREGEAAEKERKHQRYMLRKGLKQTAVELPRLEEEQMDEDAEVGPRGEHT